MAQPFNTGLPVSASWMPPHRVALLNAIAGGESRGQYNIRYTPKGGVEFSGFDKHPGIKERGPHGKSSAAGRYQFTKTTWDDLGGGAFTPERQDEMAWRLAERDYRARTGSDLDADLQDRGLDPEIIEALSPTWKALESNRPRHQKTYAQTLGELLGSEATITPAAGSAGSNETETDMAIRTGALGGFSGGYGAANRLGQYLSPSASPALAAPLHGPQNRSELLAQVLENMQEDAKRPNPQSWGETGLRALTQGIKGYVAGQKLREEDAEEQKQREMMADILKGTNPQAAEALRSGAFGDSNDWKSAVIKQMFAEPEKPDLPSSVREFEYAQENPDFAEYQRGATKPSARDRQAQMLMETGVPEDIAKGIASGRFVVSRHPTSEVAQVVDKATGQVVFDGNTQAGAPAASQGDPQPPVPDPAAPAAEQGRPSYIPENVDPTDATGASGFFGGLVNQVSDLFGQGVPFPEIEEAAEALNTTQVLTMSLLQAEVPGRPSQFLLEKLEKLTVDAKSLARADERSITRLKQTRDLIKNEADRIEKDILARPQEFRPTDMTKARLNASQLKSLLKAYDAMLGTVGTRRGESRPGLDQFRRR